MSTLFISDLHLDDNRPASTALFQKFMQTEAMQADALYILGDLFEYWLGDDVLTETGEQVASALANLSAAGIPCHFMHGNRDFPLGRRYAARCGMRLLPQELIIDLYGTPTLLMHGDTLCTDDVAYQEVRKEIRTKKWLEAFLASPPDQRAAFVQDARDQSREHQAQVSMEIMDVNSMAVVEALKRHGVTELIHGHTHRPAVHEVDVDGLTARRTVLGDWYEQGSVLRVNTAGSSLESF